MHRVWTHTSTLPPRPSTRGSISSTTYNILYKHINLLLPYESRAMPQVQSLNSLSRLSPSVVTGGPKPEHKRIEQLQATTQQPMVQPIRSI